MKKKTGIEPADESFEQTFIALMLLLFCFMVIMVSLAQLEGPRFRQAIGSVRGAFSVFNRAGGESIIQTRGTGVLPSRTAGAELERDAASLETSLEEALEDGGGMPDGMVRVEATESGVLVTLGSLVLFERGGADTRDEAGPVLDEVAGFLGVWPGGVDVIGHTCDLPIETSLYPSNWDLSIARAAEVVRGLEARGIDGHRLAAVGMGSSEPIVSNDSESHRALNRRVEILLDTGRPVSPGLAAGGADRCGQVAGLGGRTPRPGRPQEHIPGGQG